MKRIGVVLILVFAFCGLADSAYLTQHAISGTPLLCNVQGLDGCNVVATSPYSYLFGIPLAEYGIVFYGVLFILAALELALFDRMLRRIIQAVAIAGMLASLYFMALQIFAIHAFCMYCSFSALLSLLALIFAILIEPMRRTVSIPQPPFPMKSPRTLSMPPLPGSPPAS